MKAHELKAFLETHGYKQDQWGHYKKEITSTRLADNTTQTVLHRYKMQKTSVRHEVQLGEGKNKFWHRRWSQYYCNIEIRDGKIKMTQKITPADKIQEEGGN